jgi:hypothetical protein
MAEEEWFDETVLPSVCILYVVEQRVQASKPVDAHPLAPIRWAAQSNPWCHVAHHELRPWRPHSCPFQSTIRNWTSSICDHCSMVFLV